MHLQIEYKETAKLIPYVNNSRTHSDEQVKQVASSIKEFGFTNPILIDETDGIIAGHGRLMAAQLLDMQEVPTIRLVGLTQAQVKAYVIADNKLALNSGWDAEKLRLEIEDLDSLGLDLDLLGFGEVEISGILDSQIDYSLLDELVESDLDEMQGNVKKAIQIEFESEHHDEAKELISFWREKGAYIGYMVIETLRKEKDKL